MTIDYQKFTTIDTPRGERKKIGVGDIWSNEAQCNECDDIIRSKNRHDYVSCKCGNLSVDGGSQYVKRGFKKNSFKNMIIYYNDVENKI